MPATKCLVMLLYTTNEKSEKSWQSLKKIQLIAPDILALVTQASPGFNHMHYCNQPANHILKYFIFDIITVEYPQPINNMDKARWILCFRVGPDKATRLLFGEERRRTHLSHTVPGFNQPVWNVAHEAAAPVARSWDVVGKA